MFFGNLANEAEKKRWKSRKCEKGNAGKTNREKKTGKYSAENREEETRMMEIGEAEI